MYEPTEREIGIQICKTLNKIEDRLTWILGICVTILLVMLFRS